MTSIYDITNEAGDVINRIIADEAFVEAAYPGRFAYVGEVPEPPAPEPTLAPLTRRQLRLGLLSIGVTAEDVEAQINAITDPVDRAWAIIEWEDATHYKRDHPLVADVAAAMQLPPEQVDALWVWAAGI